MSTLTALSQDLPQDLPWDQGQAVLLLDGAAVPDLPLRLAACAPGILKIPLYKETRFNALSDISPLLVAIGQPDDPAFQFYLEHAAQEWGSLLFTREPLNRLTKHLRKLLTVHVAEGPEVMLRLADPAVAHALIGAQGLDERLFGPIHTWVIPDRVTGGWHRHTRALTTPADLPKRYALSVEQNAALDAVDLRRATLKLDAHLQAYFPDDRVRPLPERWPALDRQVRTAYAQGFTSQSDLTYYANIFAWLGSSPLEQHPQIARLLSTPSAQTPSARIAAAAQLASAWALAHSADKDRP